MKLWDGREPTLQSVSLKISTYKRPSKKFDIIDIPHLPEREIKEHLEAI